MFKKNPKLSYNHMQLKKNVGSYQERIYNMEQVAYPKRDWIQRTHVVSVEP